MKRGTNLILGFLLVMGMFLVVSGVGYATHKESVADEATKTLKIFKLNI